MNVTKELFYTLTDAWRAADLVARLQEWWYVVTRSDLIDSPPPEPAHEPREHLRAHAEGR